MNTNKQQSNQAKVSDSTVITMRVKKPLYEKVLALSKHQRRSLANQCMFLIEEQLALNETEKSKE